MNNSWFTNIEDAIGEKKYRFKTIRLIGINGDMF